MFGVSHGALQFMAYEEMKKYYASHYDLPYNTKLVSLFYSYFIMGHFFLLKMYYAYMIN